ncbi:diguanylate cyclase [Vibrio sp. SCSIO 43135]|uniref:diguanylate cyclase n=1 Tax=Vibrio sp. SCSIO 43135 TaxID=2819096 RepID=UPI00207578F2|nr:diguanylate cyclase [Vibrio sp. SCSIO 43135]USD42708.1 diguanylate cyclase [Vibrio sp. SCSIO 43135]
MKTQIILFLCLSLPLQVLATEIALFVPRSETAAWQSQIQFAQAAAEDLGIELRVYDANNQSQAMLKQVEQACEQGIDGILFMNYEQVGEQILSIAERYKVPSILYNTGFVSDDFLPRTKYQYWIGSITPNDQKAGSLLAEQLLIKAKAQKLESINMLVINGNMQEVSAQQRNYGLYQYVIHQPHISVVGEVDSGPNWSREEAKSHFLEQFQLNPKINMVWAASDSLALGALEAMKELSIPESSIILGGIDWLPEALEVVKSDVPYVSVGGHFTEAAWGLVLLEDYLKGNDFAAESTQFSSSMYAINNQSIGMFQSFIGDNWQRIDFRALSKANESGKLYHFSITYLLDTYYQNSNILKLTDREVAWLKQHPYLRLAIDNDWPPFEYVDEDMIYQGMAADYIKIIAKRLGIELLPSIDMSWSEVVEASKRRELDIYPALAITPNRKEYLNFTRPYLSFPMLIITNQQRHYIADLNSLNGKEVAVVKGYASNELLRENHPEIILYEARNVADALEAVSTGRVAAYVGNIATANYVMTREGYTNLKVAGATPYRFDLSMAARNDWPILHSILQKALDSLSEEEKKAIYSRWITVRYEHGVDYNLVWKIVLAALLVLALLSYWTHKLSNLNLKLNNEVTERKQIEQQLRHEKSKIEKLSITDPLTGLFNRRHYNQILPDEIRRAQRAEEWLSFVILDVDYFKQYNDNYGHHNGDSQLISIANTLKTHCHRASDFSFRLGGEEFGLIFSGLSPSQAEKFVEQIRKAIEDLQLEHKYSKASTVLTASFGLVTTNMRAYSMEQLYEAADDALYSAKENGRNQVVSKVME